MPTHPNESEPLLPPPSGPARNPSHGGTSTTSSRSATSPTASRRLQGRRYTGLSPGGEVSDNGKVERDERGKGKGRGVAGAWDRKGKARARDIEEGPLSEGEGWGSSDEDEDEAEERVLKKDKGKGRALPLPSAESNGDAERTSAPPQPPGRPLTIIFSNPSLPNLSLHAPPTAPISQIKSLIRSARPELAGLKLRLIHAGRLLADGVVLVPWVGAMEERVRRQAGGVGGDVESVLKEVGLGEEGAGEGGGRTGEETRGGGRQGAGEKKQETVWIHCIVGGKEETPQVQETAAQPSAPRRRGFDVLLDAGLSPADVAQMRRQFYESRGEEVPEGMDLGDINDEHARALEEQWIEGDLTADTATTSTEGLYTSILQGLLTGFLFPLMAWFFFRELPLPNFFDADAEAEAEFARWAGVPLPGAGTGTGAGGGSGSGPGSGAGGPSQAGSSQADDPNSNSSNTDPNSNLQPNTSTTTASTSADTDPDPARRASARVAANLAVGGMSVPSQVFGKRMQMGILLGTILNLAFGALRMIN
ncbi:hypothetical protein IAT38_007197 [Cryptococcus sp. DSM 104549]